MSWRPGLNGLLYIREFEIKEVKKVKKKWRTDKKKMRIKREVFEISARIVGYLASRSRGIAYHRDLIGNFESDLSTERGKKTFSDSLNLLEEFGVVQELGTDAYELTLKEK